MSKILLVFARLSLFFLCPGCLEKTIKPPPPREEPPIFTDRPEVVIKAGGEDDIGDSKADPDVCRSFDPSGLKRATKAARELGKSRKCTRQFNFDTLGIQENFDTLHNVQVEVYNLQTADFVF